jgi:hypothetical protein
MFIQVITGKVADAAEFRRVGELWDTNVRPVAKGFLGSTEGTTDDGRFFVAARFESAETAAQNSDLPEQQAWYKEFEKTATDVQFHDCDEVITMLGGGSDDAKFVQVMVGKIKDRAKFDALNAKAAEMERVFSEWRDDVLGEVLAVHNDGSGYHDVIYFKNEELARAGEKQEPTPEVQALMGEMDAAAEIVEYLDLRDLSLR